MRKKTLLQMDRDQVAMGAMGILLRGMQGVLAEVLAGRVTRTNEFRRLRRNAKGTSFFFAPTH